jgi:hypothetical protein
MLKGWEKGGKASHSPFRQRQMVQVLHMIAHDKTGSVEMADISKTDAVDDLKYANGVGMVSDQMDDIALRVHAALMRGSRCLVILSQKVVETNLLS